MSQPRPTPALLAGIPRHFVEGFAAAAIPVVFAVRLFPTEASLLSVCLAALLTVDGVGRLSEARGLEPGHLVARLAATFTGSALGYALLALLLPRADARTAFARQLAYLPDARLEHAGFGDFGAILLANLYVLLFFLAVAFGFRKGGLMLAVAWNASVWGAVFGTLAREGGLLPFLAAAGPHMAAEAAAYVAGGLGGVLLGRGVLRVALRGEDRWDVLVGAAGRLLLLAVGLLCAAATWEAFIATRILVLLR